MTSNQADLSFLSIIFYRPLNRFAGKLPVNSTVQCVHITGLLIFRAVAEPRISSKSAKSHEIPQKSDQIHVGTTYLKVILAVGAAYLL